MRRKPTQNSSDEADPDLLAHLRTLRLTSIEEYQEWCDRNGFSRRLRKHWRLRLKERTFANRAVADARLAQKKDESRRPEKVIEQIFAGQVPEDRVTQAPLQALCRAYNASKDCRHTKRNTLQLLLHVCPQTDLLSSEPVITEYGWQEGNSYVEALVAVARHWAGWKRPLTDWRPRSHNTQRQFSSLVRHLFAEWPVPSFMDSVWFKRRTTEARRQQGWFLHLGKGENIRHADLPMPFTKRMAHHFMQAPVDLSVEAALRWGQIQALGGDERLARCLIGTRLGTRFEHEDFWITVLRWLIAHPMLDPAQVGPLIDYIRFQRFMHREEWGPNGITLLPPPQPNFSMKGRSPESLLRQVHGWHEQLARTEQPQAEWRTSGIKAFEFLEGNERSGNLKLWTMTELLSSKSLYSEGRKMKHCVSTYARSCAAGSCSIWTLEVESCEGKRKLLTVEVNNSAKLICQARGKCNALPGDKHRGILRRWAEQAGLRLTEYV